MNPHPPPPSGPPPPPPPSNLPPGWSEHRDQTGRVYYHNARTNETSWYRPTSTSSAPPPPPPPPPEAPNFHYGSAAIAASNTKIDYPSHTTTHREANIPSSSHQYYQQEYIPGNGAPPDAYPPPPPQSVDADPYAYNYAQAQAPPPPHQAPLHHIPSHHHHPPQYGPPGGINIGGPPPGYAGGPPPGGAESMHGQSYASGYVPPGGGYGYGGAGVQGQGQGGGGGYGGRGGGSDVRLEFSATGLKKKDLIGKSDPMVVVYMEKLDVLGQKKWTEVGRTEKIMNDHSPRWAKRVMVSYRFYELQRMRLAVFDVDKGGKLSYDDELGLVQTDLGHVMSAGVFKASLTKMNYVRGVPKPVQGSSSQGELTVRVHNASVEGQSKVFMTMTGQGLDRKDGLLGKSDPYYIVNQLMPNNDYSVVYKSETLKGTLNPTWRPAEFVLNTQGQPPHKIQLRVDCYDWDKYTPHDLIGRANVTLSQFSSGITFGLINESKQKRKGKRYTDSGKMTVSGYRLVHFPQFYSYMQAGLKIHLTVGIDFTASNGPPSNPKSLHHLGNMQMQNQYVQALSSVGEILNSYTRDGMIAAFGFGAKQPPNNVTSFNFPLDPIGNQYCYGVQGLLEAYRQRVASVEFSGPTNFAPLIQTARDLASREPLSARNLTYHCLMILTDGAITDMTNTVDAIIECSHAVPMSIVIIGVGNADFSKMNRLDADDQVLTSDNRRQKAKRDIVQFVPFRKYVNDPHKDGLSADVLAELPSRIVETMVDAGIMPEHVPVAY